MGGIHRGGSVVLAVSRRRTYSSVLWSTGFDGPKVRPCQTLDLPRGGGWVGAGEGYQRFELGLELTSLSGGEFAKFQSEFAAFVARGLTHDLGSNVEPTGSQEQDGPERFA
jgi:hypothetical protein